MADERFLNRELSWLAFNDRVLQLAAESGIPLLERAKFCAITCTNLDEFFQVRVAALKDQIVAAIDRPSPDGRTPAQNLAEVNHRVLELIDRVDTVFVDGLVPELRAAGVDIISWDDVTTDEREVLDEWFEERVFPVLTPLAVDPGHPFPYISDLALSLAVNVADPETGDRRFARLKVPRLFPRLVEPSPGRFLPVEQLIAAKLDRLFVGMIVEDWAPFRVSRNADLTLEEEEADDLLEAVEMELRRRRFNKAVRLEVSHDIGAEVLELLVRELDLTMDDVTFHRAPLDLSCLWQLLDLDRPDLKDEAWPPVTAGRIIAAEETDRPIFDVIRHRAIMLHHPYESFASSVETFISQAADDPKVQSIKMTLYRAGGDSGIIRSLMRAAERGVQVAVLVELKARFDEANNVQWARQLERSGVHVVYGMVGLKTHSKVALVVRDDLDQLRRYVHIGTGNYNAKTARIYEDLGVLTCAPDIGDDAAQLFNHLTGYSRSDDYRNLLVAPRDLRRQLVDLIEHEASFGPDGHITLKCNSIADDELIETLYRASAAGTRIDIVVRGICCLRAGVAGLSENIRVRSILGRYLEHSRIYRFGHGNVVHGERLAGATSDQVYLIGSADLMPRNLNRRVEVMVPIEHARHTAALDQALAFALADDIVAWELQPDDTWLRIGPTESFEPHAQERMYRWMVEQQLTGRT
ncbi:MAG: polyphosphate kinase 1 [Ilumatobacteraceae bacterium]